MANSFRAPRSEILEPDAQVCDRCKTACLLTKGLHRGHGRLAHALRWEARGADASLAWHHALLLESRPPLFLQLLLNLVDFLCQQVVILRLGGGGGGKEDVRRAETLQTSHSGRNGGPARGVFKARRRVRGCLTLVFADSYMSPSTFRAYATRFSIRRSLSAAGSGVGKMACTLLRKRAQKTQGG